MQQLSGSRFCLSEDQLGGVLTFVLEASFLSWVFVNPIDYIFFEKKIVERNLKKPKSQRASFKSDSNMSCIPALSKDADFDCFKLKTSKNEAPKAREVLVARAPLPKPKDSESESGDFA